jgi:hypothetical protein
LEYCSFWAGRFASQTYISTIAGTDRVLTSPAPATPLSLGPITSAVSDGSGNLYIADVGRNDVFRMTSTGVLEVLFGKSLYVANDGR